MTITVQKERARIRFEWGYQDGALAERAGAPLPDLKLESEYDPYVAGRIMGQIDERAGVHKGTSPAPWEAWSKGLVFTDPAKS
jgi:hypothetical protein